MKIEGLLLDEENKDLLDRYGWYVSRGYVVADTGNRKDGTRRVLRLHRVVIGAKEGQIVDHIDHNPLNNKRSNLRICNRSQNGMNRGRQSNNKSGYKNVSWNEQKRKWRVSINKDKKCVFKKNYKTLERAIGSAKLYTYLIHQEYARY